MIKGLLEGGGIVSNKEALANTKNAIDNWNLGPEVVDKPNNDYWQKMAKIFNVSEDQARSQVCANCEYYNNTPDTLQEMKSKYPLNKFDIYNSFYHRGYCEKLHFACHTTRCCQAWEEKEYKQPDMED